ncbi:hypothetical protein AB0P07_14895 [Streptomyces sp. NPDC085944]|uniref:hypothetical protein n=1 Tax=Streptomyces sp. NPDC085944 TaxID=3154962 RepID=UPI003422549B
MTGEVQRAVVDPTSEGSAGKGDGFVTDLTELVAEFRTTFARIEDLLADVDGLDLTVYGYESVRTINAFLDTNPDAAEVFAKDYRLLARLYSLINADKRVAKYQDGFGLFGSVYTTLFKKSSDEERKERLGELGPMVLEIINAHVRSFSVAASQEEALVLDAQGIAILKELLALVRPKPGKDDGEDMRRPSAAEILDHIKAALEEGVEPRSEKYTALAERIRQLRDRITERPGHPGVPGRSTPGCPCHRERREAPGRSRRAGRRLRGCPVTDHPRHAPPGLTVTEQNLAEEIDQVVKRTLAQSWDNAEALNRGVRRATAAVFRRYMLKPVGEPYGSTVAYVEAHYLVD